MISKRLSFINKNFMSCQPSIGKYYIINKKIFPNGVYDKNFCINFI